MIHLKITNLDSGEYREVLCAPMLNAQNECTIGSSKSCDLVLDSPDVSRVHAKIVVQSEAYFLVDDNSEAGSFLNDEKLKPDKCYKLNASDAIVIGHFFILVHRIDDRSKPV